MATKLAFDKEGAFYSTLNERVSTYFKQNNKTQKADLPMIYKSVALMLFLLLVYLSLIFIPFGGWWFLGIYALLGVAVALTTMNISHDGLHGSYLSNAKANRMLGYLMDICGKSSFYWGNEHVLDHHVYTNIGGKDHDLLIENPFLRLSPEAPYQSYQRFQHWYAPLMYGLHPLYGIFDELKKTYTGLTQDEPGVRKPTVKDVTAFFVLKIVHLALFIVVPKIMLSLTWPEVFLGYVFYAIGVGLTLSFVFQLAHIVDNVRFPVPNSDGVLGESFLEHQLNTTSNFSTHSVLAHFFFGGLNFQVEHHLFPYICHSHLRNISPIVKATALEYGLPYHENPSLYSALKSHFRMLKKLGTNPIS